MGLASANGFEIADGRLLIVYGTIRPRRIVAGARTAVNGNSVNESGGHGIVAGDRSTVDGNTSNNNARSGTVVGDGGTVNGNAASNNGGTVVGNTANDNASFGLQLGPAVGYAYNVLNRNNAGAAQVSGGVQTGGNLCNGAPCP